MKTVIYYFTGTGNSLSIARGLASRLKDTELIDIRYLNLAVGNRLTADRVGIVFPVYAFGPPQIVKRFLQGLIGSEARYVFAVCNCAGNQGTALQMVKEELKKRNIALDASFNVIMPSNYIPFGGAKSEEVTAGILRQAEKRLDFVANMVLSGQYTRPDNARFFPHWLSRLIYNYFCRSAKKAGRKFLVADQCTGCGLCEKICPVGNIGMVDGKPRWDNHCEVCMACLQWCPAEAIALGKPYPGRKHYHHPEVKPSDLTP